LKDQNLPNHTASDHQDAKNQNYLNVFTKNNFFTSTYVTKLNN